MARTPRKKEVSRRRPSDTPPPTPSASTPQPRGPPRNPRRAQSTPRRRSSRTPFPPFFTPGHRRSQYPPRVRALCQQDAYKRLPADQKAYMEGKVSCPRCLRADPFTQHIAFKAGHAGEWVRAVRNLLLKVLL